MNCRRCKGTGVFWTPEEPFEAIENFIDRQIEDMDESGQWSTHAINALLVLQSRIDDKLKELGNSRQ
jgi:hypothetical protein